MGLARSYLVSLLLYITVVNEIRLPQVTCQDDENTQCMPKTTFLALLRLPEVSSTLAAYSRSERVMQDGKDRDDVAHLKALSEENDDTEICIPGGIYLELLRDPAMRGHLSVIGRTQKLPEFPGRLYDESEEADSGDLFLESQKRSISTLAKNGDLPISIQDRNENEEEEEKRSVESNSEQSRRSVPEFLREYLLSNGDMDMSSLAQDFSADKRNVGSLARDFALPPGRRNVASLARDYGLPSGKRNVAALARDRMLPYTGKRNVASLARDYGFDHGFPRSGKRNIGSVVRDYGLPYGKRYVGSLARTSGFPLREDEKRSVASLARNSDWPGSSKRGGSAPGGMIMRTLSRHGRSVTDRLNVKSDPMELQKLADQDENGGTKSDGKSLGMAEDFGNTLTRNWPNRNTDDNGRRSKRQIDFSDEYPLPVMQNTNILDYEELMDALTGQYPNAEKRFMGSGSEMEENVAQFGYPEVFQESKRHIGSLARLGWLSSLRAARFSRSPRYLVDRENSANGATGKNFASGATPDYSVNTSTWSLRPNFYPRRRYVQALHGDCRHGFKRSLLLPTADKFLRQKFVSSPNAN